MFVATANDRATEKDCLFLELSFNLKKIKINIESFFFKEKYVEKKSILSQPTLPLAKVEWEYNLELEVCGLGLSPGPAMSSLSHGMSPSPISAGPKVSCGVRASVAAASSLSFRHCWPHRHSLSQSGLGTRGCALHRPFSSAGPDSATTQFEH